MAPPLLSDLRNQRHEIRRLLPRLTLFLLILAVLDRALAGVMLHGLEHYYGLDAPADVLLVGHSHTVLGVDHERLATLTGARVAKYARQGATLADRQVMIRQFLERHPEEAPVVVYDVEAHLFNRSGLGQNSYHLFLPFLNENSVAEYLRSQNIGSLEKIIYYSVATSRFDETSVATSARGIAKDWRSFKDGGITDARLRRQIDNYKPIEFDLKQIARLRATARDVTNRGGQFVLAFYPTLDIYNSMEPQRFAAVQLLLRQIADEEPGVHYVDYTTTYSHRHELFYDAIHLNQRGQSALTESLSIDLTRLGLMDGNKR